MMRFDVFTPDSLTEVIALLNEFGEGAKVLAGGTDLLVRIKQGMLSPSKIISLHFVSSPESIRYEEGKGLWIGPLVTHAEVAAHAVAREKFTALTEACSVVGSPQVRNIGTVVGNIVNASPAADTAPALLALQSEVIVRNDGGSRTIPLSDFYTGPGRTVLRPGEIVEAVFIPEPVPGTVSAYLKLGRRQALEIAICGVAISARIDRGIGESVRIALGAVAPTPLLTTEAAGVLHGCTWSKQVLQEAGRLAARGCAPIDDQRASAEYRREMVNVLVQRAGRQLANRVGGGPNS